jgi:hypothetical protein
MNIRTFEAMKNSFKILLASLVVFIINGNAYTYAQVTQRDTVIKWNHFEE